ncbi:MAG: hypothetical protein IJF54_01615 [Clostridia bacterium]|nr:hypothetical protein [Clostridia bacterium]
MNIIPLIILLLQLALGFFIPDTHLLLLLSVVAISAVYIIQKIRKKKFKGYLSFIYCNIALAVDTISLYFKGVYVEDLTSLQAFLFITLIIYALWYIAYCIGNAIEDSR